MTDVDLAALFAIAPTEFVAARNTKVKALRAAKRRDEATALAGLRRPSWVDWALNAASTAHDVDAGAFGAAAGELREAQAAAIEGRDGPDLKASLRALRDATSAFAQHAATALVAADRSPDAGELAARLSEVAADPATVDQLLAGVLGSSETDGPDLFAGLTPAKRPASRAKERPAKATRRTGKRATASADEDAADEDAADEDAAAKAAEQRAALEAALAAAERDRDTAATDAAVADEEVVAAESAEADARAVLDTAQHAAKDARARRRAAHKTLDRLDEAVAAAHSALTR